MALFVALVVCWFGIASLLTNTDVLADQSLGPLVGPIAVGSATIWVGLVLGRLLNSRRSTFAMLALCTGGSWIIAVICVFLGQVLATNGTALAGFLAATGFGVGVYGAAIPVSAFVVAIAAITVARMQAGGVPRPRWPWERGDADVS